MAKKNRNQDDSDLDDVSVLEGADQALADTPDKNADETGGDPTSDETQTAAVREAISNKGGVPIARHPKPTALAGQVKPEDGEYRLLPGKKHTLTQPGEDAYGNPNIAVSQMQPGDTVHLIAHQAAAFADKFERA